ncbi:zinc-binding alcohol dehydrogenase family protein [Bacillus swezeyi]|uniref:Alcohol dehydrogenase n=1 Tax=Bacillus swezeyi TaxID=1925020 RepID=A0A5M8S0M1_9BACI|nr:zinc-binding alcohol dehydrogenase family protein [Bacillus swezeyi]KAA6453190.1 alcohol dehydrogenase [Bacillus swezeyi]KAA6476191.1 alcohol dehydrogenase [Bacillus swezeyi]TYS38560.1 zinc-binding alcohol dehydrogenase family protein [Bacillus swezeyi]
MKAAVMTKPYSINFQDIPCPEPDAHEVLVRVKTAGICGSDVHFYDGSNPYGRYPQIFGHELSGIIEKTGAGVKKRSLGERVVIEPAISCGSCYPCRKGKTNACVNIDMIGSVRRGGFADFLAVPETHVHPIPDHMDFVTGALCEPFAIGAQAIKRASIQHGVTIVILGMGPIGLTILAQVKKRFQADVIAVDPVRERLELARMFGADSVIHPVEEHAEKTISKLTNGEGAGIVFEAAGIPATIEQSVRIAAPGGRIVIVGLTGEDVTIPGLLLTKKDIEIHGTKHSVNQFPRVIEFLNENPQLAQSFVTEIMPFMEIEEALKKAKNCPEQVTKIILSY